MLLLKQVIVHLFLKNKFLQISDKLSEGKYFGKSLFLSAGK